MYHVSRAFLFKVESRLTMLFSSNNHSISSIKLIRVNLIGLRTVDTGTLVAAKTINLYSRVVTEHPTPQ